jgi:integrase
VFLLARVKTGIFQLTAIQFSGSRSNDRLGNRKYLTAGERRLFLDAVEKMPPDLRTFCRVLSYTGARISEIEGRASVVS